MKYLRSILDYFILNFHTCTESVNLPYLHFLEALSLEMLNEDLTFIVDPPSTARNA